MNWRIGKSTLAAVLIVAPATGWCGFTCQRDGKTSYGDEIPRECAGLEVREFYPDGTLKRVISAPLTEEQKKENARKEKELQACIQLNREQHNKDAALLNRYEHEEDIQEARYRAVGDQLRRVDQADARMKEILKKGMVLTQEAMFYQPPNQMPDELQRSRNVNARLERDQLRVIENAIAEIGHINETYDADLERYQALINHTVKIPCNPEKMNETVQTP